MRISKKLIAQTCLPIYKQLLEKGKRDNRNRFLKRLDKNNTNYGICALYDSINNNKGIYNFKPLEKVCKVNRYGENRSSFSCWYAQIPNVCDTKKEMVECINKRVQLLESWL